MRVLNTFSAALGIAILSTAVLASTPPNPASPPPPPEPGMFVAYGNLVYSDGEVFWREVLVLSSSGTLGLDDELFFLKFCPDTSPFICIHGENYDYDFAIPKRDLSVGETWSFNGKTFKVVPNITFSPPAGFIPKSEKALTGASLLGQDLTFYVIALLGKKGKYPERLFFFSKDRGLIGEADPTEDRYLAPSWLLEGVGPGSKKFDSQITPKAFLKSDELDKLLKGHVEWTR